MEEQTLREGLAELSRLSQQEYNQDLSSLMKETNEDARTAKLARLAGVVLKQPFATPIELASPSPYSGAIRAWELVGEKAFEVAAAERPWQLHVIQQMQRELGLEQMAPYDLAQAAHHEVGFFGFFARSARKYICGDKEVRRKVKQALRSVGKPGEIASNLTPEHIVGAGGLTLGTVLVQNVPLLGVVGAPVIAALVVILYTLGVDAFCRWTEHLSTQREEGG